MSFVMYLERYAWGFVKTDVQKEYGWTDTTLGWLDGLTALSYGLAQVPAGALCDWFGARVVLGGSVMAWSVALAAITVAVGVVAVGAARLGFGVAQAAGYPALNKVSKNWFPVASRPVAQGLIATFFGRGGGAAAFLLFGFLLGTLALPWRVAVLIVAAAGLVFGVVFLVLFRNTPRAHPWANPGEAELVVAGDPEAAFATGSRLNWADLARSAAVWLLLARAMLANMADVVFASWLPLYLMRERGLGGMDAGLLSALPLAGGAVGGLVSGWAQSRLVRRSRRWARSGVGLGGKAAAGLLMLASLTLADPVAVVAAFVLVKFFSDTEQPAEWGTISDIAGRNAATVFACVNTAGAVGAFVGGLVIGGVLDAYRVDGRPTPAGWEAVFAIAAVEYFLGAACWLFIDARRPITP